MQTYIYNTNAKNSQSPSYVRLSFTEYAGGAVAVPSPVFSVVCAIVTNIVYPVVQDASYREDDV